jgi:hypothetical protein
MNLKNKKSPQIQNKPEIKIFLELIFVFRRFQGN